MNNPQVTPLHQMLSPQEYEQLSSLQINYLLDLIALLEIKSVKDKSTADANAPMGVGNKQALDFMLQLAQRDGFTVCNIDNIAGHIEWGNGSKIIGMIGHLDVVPADNDWSITPPFRPLIKNGYLYARGVSDDKGPMLAAYYAMKQLQQQGIIANKRIRLIFGTDEESDWQCVDTYFKQQQKPDIGFSPDAQFPIVNSEKGSVSMQLDFTPDDTLLVDFYSGEKRNIVPNHAKATLRLSKEQAELLSSHFSVFLEENSLTGHIDYDDFQLVTYNLIGVSCHGSQPILGKNAGTYLAYWLNHHIPNHPFLSFTAQYLHLNYTGSHFAEKLNTAQYADVTLNTGIMRYNAQEALIQINFRYPSSITQAELVELIKSKNLSKITCQVIGQPKSPHFVPEDSLLVQTLKHAYQQITGQEAYCLTSGGGTFARLFENCVGFGALFPDDEDTMHQKNEKSALAHLFLTIDIYTQALKNLLALPE